MGILGWLLGSKVISALLTFWRVQAGGGTTGAEEIGRFLGGLTILAFLIWVAFVILVFVSLLLWLLVPFAIFGIRNRMDKLEWQLQRVVGAVGDLNDTVRVRQESRGNKSASPAGDSQD